MIAIVTEECRIMEVIIQKDAPAAAGLTARLIAAELRANPALVLGLATGRTMESVYALLAGMHQRDGLDFSLCRTFNLDEYVGLAPESKHSYRSYMNHHLFGKVNLDWRNTHLPNGAASDLAAECLEYENQIQRAGGIDFQLLGIGQDGHIGFNEPLSALRSRTRPKALSPETLVQNGPLFDSPEQMPRRALTMGVGTILKASAVSCWRSGRQGGYHRQGGGRSNHGDDFRVFGAAVASALHGDRGRSGCRQIAGRGILPLDFRKRAGMEPYRA